MNRLPSSPVRDGMGFGEWRGGNYTNGLAMQCKKDRE
ncbi:hypothetical protein QQF64_032627, partial [Cirrhinus molitorella]